MRPANRRRRRRYDSSEYPYVSQDPPLAPLRARLATKRHRRRDLPQRAVWEWYVALDAGGAGRRRSEWRAAKSGGDRCGPRWEGEHDEGRATSSSPTSGPLPQRLGQPMGLRATGNRGSH